jgi:signal transduction histidine kinase
MSTGTRVPGRPLRVLKLPPLNWIAVVLAVLGLGGTYVLYTQLQSMELQHLKRRTATELGHVAHQTQDGLAERLYALQSLAQWWISQGRPLDIEDWKSDSRLFLDRASGLAEVRWVDPGFHVQWSVHPGDLPAALSGELAPEMRACANAARNREAPVVCGSPQDGNVTVFAAARREGHVIGYAVGTYRVTALLDAALAELPADYDVSIRAEGRKIYHHPAAAAWSGDRLSAPIRLPGMSWSLSLALPASETTVLRFCIAVFGLLVTLLLCLTAQVARISRRRAAELTKAYAALMEEERGRKRGLADFQTLLDVVPIGIAVAQDAACRIIWTNPALGAMLGAAPGQNISKSGNGVGSRSFRMLRGGVEVPACELPMQRAAATGSPVLGEEMELVRADGAVVHTLSYSAPLFDESGAVRGVVNACVDITGKKRAEREKELLVDRLKRSEKYKSLALMAGGMAHDFNNLLTAIIGHASMACEDAPVSGNLREHLEDCLSASGRAATLVKQLLAYSGNALHQLENTDLTELIREMRNEIRAGAPGSVHLEFRLAEGLPPIRADRSELRAAIRNVVANSVEALAGGEGRIEIQTGLCELLREDIAGRFPDDDLQPGGYVRLEIRDTGCGMSPEVARRIFDPFYTTKFTGRGLGLPAAQGIVRAHRGAIRVETSLGRGTRVEIVFPR